MKVVLGGIELKTFEKPDFIQMGGKQMLAIREFPGGGVSIQDMGPTYRNLSWSGEFKGKDAYDRMMKIGLMRTSGKPIQLVTDKFTMNVIIEEFYPDFKTSSRIPFSISLRRVIDNSKSIAAKDPVDLVKAPSNNVVASVKESIVKHIVKNGDTLQKIAKVYFKDANKWENIYADNKPKLKDGPHKLKVGTELVIKVV